MFLLIYYIKFLEFGLIVEILKFNLRIKLIIRLDLEILKIKTTFISAFLYFI